MLPFRGKQPPIDKRDVVLATLYFIQKHSSYAIMTQLHKILTIAQEESGTKVFEIVPDKFGPRVVNLYETLKELETEGLVIIERIERQGSKHGYDYMVRIRLTEEGVNEAHKAVKRLLRAGKGALIGTLEAWADAPYKALIYYVYKAYPKYMTKSVIANSVKEGEY